MSRNRIPPPGGTPTATPSAALDPVVAAALLLGYGVLLTPAGAVLITRRDV